MGGTDGVFAPMLKHLLESMMDGELDSHLAESKSSGESNRRNGKTKKLFIVHQIRTSLRYVPEKDKKAVVEDLKPVYKAN
ncbi:hypothetical protein SAMN05443550_1354, partial [Pedobacter hartonius]